MRDASDQWQNRDVIIGGIHRRDTRRHALPSWDRLVQTKLYDASGFGLRTRGPLVGSTNNRPFPQSNYGSAVRWRPPGS